MELLLLLSAHLIKNIGVLLVNLLGHFLLLFLELSDALVGIDAGAHTAEDYRADDEQKDQPDGAKVEIKATDVEDVTDTGLIVELGPVLLIKLMFGPAKFMVLNVFRHIYVEINYR